MDSIPERILEILRAGHLEGTRYYLPAEQLDRATYQQLNVVLNNAGGKWNRKAKAHVFESDPNVKLGLAIETGTTVNEKKLYQFFETPQDIADRVVELAAIKDGMTVLEPSAGHGAILDQIDRALDIGVIFVELDPAKVAVLEAKGYQGYCEDFLRFSPAACDVDKPPEEVTDADLQFCLGEFERIVMNPPFTKQQDIDHVEHAYYAHLADGGRLVAVMSPAFTYRTNRKSVAFRQLVDLRGSWEKNPTGSFKQSGTNVETVTVVLNKPTDPKLS